MQKPGVGLKKTAAEESKGAAMDYATAIFNMLDKRKKTKWVILMKWERNTTSWKCYLFIYLFALIHN